MPFSLIMHPDFEEFKSNSSILVDRACRRGRPCAGAFFPTSKHEANPPSLPPCEWPVLKTFRVKIGPNSEATSYMIYTQVLPSF